MCQCINEYCELYKLRKQRTFAFNTYGNCKSCGEFMIPIPNKQIRARMERAKIEFDRVNLGN